MKENLIPLLALITGVGLILSGLYSTADRKFWERLRERRKQDKSRRAELEAYRAKRNEIYRRMKVLTALALFLGVMGSMGIMAQQTNGTPPGFLEAGPLNLNFLTNIVTASNFQATTFGVKAGVLLRNGTLENELKGDYYFRTNWMFSAAIQNAPSASVVDNFTLFPVGYRKAWLSSEIHGQGLIRRTWGQNAGDKSGWQGGLSIGASWLPIDGGHVNVGTDFRLLTSPVGPTLNTRPSGEIVVQATLDF